MRSKVRWNGNWGCAKSHKLDVRPEWKRRHGRRGNFKIYAVPGRFGGEAFFCAQRGDDRHSWPLSLALDALKQGMCVAGTRASGVVESCRIIADGSTVKSTAETRGQDQDWIRDRTCDRPKYVIVSGVNRTCWCRDERKLWPQREGCVISAKPQKFTGAEHSFVRQTERRAG